MHSYVFKRKFRKKLFILFGYTINDKKPSCCWDGRPYCPIADDLCKSCGAFMKIGPAVFS